MGLPNLSMIYVHTNSCIKLIVNSMVKWTGYRGGTLNPRLCINWSLTKPRKQCTVVVCRYIFIPEVLNTGQHERLNSVGNPP